MKALAITATVLLLAGCAVETAATATSSTTTTTTTTTISTLPPVDTTTTTIAPAFIEQAEPGACDHIDVSNTSALIPESWEEWCIGFLSMQIEMDQTPDAEYESICLEFWNTPDDELLVTAMDNGFTEDAGIGAIDALWINC